MRRSKKLLVGSTALGAAVVIGALCVVAWPYVIETWAIRQLESRDAAAWRAAAEQLIESGSRRSIGPIVTTALERDTERFAEWHGQLLRRHGAKVLYAESLSAHLQAVRSDDTEVREAMLGIDRRGEALSDDLVTICLAALESPDPQTRRGGAHGLGLLWSFARRAVPQLATAARDPIADVRVEAVRALGRVGRENDDAVAALVAALADAEDNVAVSAADALRRWPSQASATVKPLGVMFRRGGVRGAHAAVALASIGPAARSELDAVVESMGVLEERWVWLLSSDTFRDEDARVNVVANLRRSGMPAATAVPLLTGLLGLAAAEPLETRARDLRDAAALELGRYGVAAAPAVGRLVELLVSERAPHGDFLRGDWVGDANWNVAWALGAIGTPAVEPLVAALDSSSEEYRRAAIFALGATGDASAGTVAALRRTARDHELALDVIHALALLGVDATRDVLEFANREPQRALSLVAFLHSPSEGHLPTLLDALRADDSARGPVAAKIVGRLADVDGIAQRVIPALEEAAASTDADLRLEAELALARYRGPSAALVQRLVDLARNDPEDEMRRRAIAELARLGSAARAAVPDLVELLRGPPRISVQLTAALVAIAPESDVADRACCRPLEAFLEPSEAVDPVHFYLYADALFDLPALSARVTALLERLRRRGCGRCRAYAIRLLCRIPDRSPELVDDVGGLLAGSLHAGSSLVQTDSGRYVFESFAVSVGVVAAQTAASLGPRAASLVPLLRDALDSDDDRLVVAAAHALWKVAGEDHRRVVVEMLGRNILVGPWSDEVWSYELIGAALEYLDAVEGREPARHANPFHLRRRIDDAQRRVR